MTGGFGARLAAAPPSERFDLHIAHGEREGFADYDHVLARLFDRLLRGEATIRFEPAKRRTDLDRVTLEIGDRDREALGSILSPAAQEGRGAWYIPKDEKLPVGVVEFARWAKAEPRFANSAADAQRAAVTLDGPDTVAIWAALQLVMERLYLPLKLRSGYWLGDRRPELMTKDWAVVDAAYAALGIDTHVLDVFKDGRAWAALSIDGVVAARQDLLDAWQAAPTDVGERAVVLLIGLLADRYYQKARDGRAQRTKVLNKDLERALSAAFGGDWLALVRYLGEEPHPSEQVTTAVESTSLYVSGRSRAASAATATGVPIEEIERIMSAYWGGRKGSPVEERVEVMREWWRVFDDLQAQQASGVPSLSGLLGEPHDIPFGMPQDAEQSPTSDGRIPGYLDASIRRLWGTTMLPRWPNVLVSEPQPYVAFASAFGAAARFWHQVGQVCWLVCEGSWEPSVLDELPTWYEWDLKRLEELGCGIDAGLFSDLRAASEKLRERPLEERRKSGYPVGNGLVLTMRVGSGQRDGFEHLRDVVTHYRRTWAQTYLEPYIRQRWEGELVAAGDGYHRIVADKGKPPTLKQFAKLAREAANHWFGGDLAGLTHALGLPAPDSPVRRRLLPPDTDAFVSRVRELLGGIRWQDAAEDMEEEEREQRFGLTELAEEAPELVQLWEATGNPPQMPQAAPWRLRLERAFSGEVEAGWATLMDALHRVLAEQGVGPPVENPT